MMGSQHIDEYTHRALLDKAVHVEPFSGDRDPRVGGDMYKHTIKKKVHVPVEQEVKVPVVKRTVERQIERKVVQGAKMTPVKKYRDIQETVLETKEEVVEGFRERWVKVKEPTREVVKKQVPITRTKRVPYVDYVEQKVQQVVEVPRDVVKEKRGYRVDKHIGTKVVEVEEDHHYEMRPVYVGKGDQRARDTGDYFHHGKMKHGRSAFDSNEQWKVVRGGGGAQLRAKSSDVRYGGSNEWTSGDRYVQRSASQKQAYSGGYGGGYSSGYGGGYSGGYSSGYKQRSGTGYGSSGNHRTYGNTLSPGYIDGSGAYRTRSSPPSECSTVRTYSSSPRRFDVHRYY